MRLEETMKAISKIMRSQFKASKESLKHGGLKGGDRAGKVAKFLRDYLPKKFEITNGEIIAIDGGTSNEEDIIIYDGERCPILYVSDEPKIQVVPSEGVYAVIEVKSILTDEELEKSIKNIRSVKKLSKKAYITEKSPLVSQVIELGKLKCYFNTMGILFAFSSQLSLKTIKQKLKEKYKKLKIPKEHQIDLIFLLDKGLLVHYNKNKKQINTTVELDTEMGYINAPSDDGLLLFYLMLMDRLGLVCFPPINIKEYVQVLNYKINID